jgi:hypothetical protein
MIKLCYASVRPYTALDDRAQPSGTWAVVLVWVAEYVPHTGGSLLHSRCTSRSEGLVCATYIISSRYAPPMVAVPPSDTRAF